MNQNTFLSKSKVEKIKDRMEDVEKNAVSNETTEVSLVDPSEKNSLKSISEYLNTYFSRYLGYFDMKKIVKRTSNFVFEKKKEWENCVFHVFFMMYTFFESSLFLFLAPIAKIYYSSKFS